MGDGGNQKVAFVNGLCCLWLNVERIIGFLPSGDFDCGYATSGYLRQRLDLDQASVDPNTRS